MRLDESTPIEVIAAFLRMGRKYDMDVIRVEALLKLFDAVPITLDAYKPAQSDYALLREAPRWFKILDLSREFEVQSTLPFTFYQCCRILHDCNFMGVDKANALSALIRRLSA
ncbi:hypothetical protein FIBSPDRAFT_858442 [Athelia psychrophila]|uniref:Uncharacterized protein n=1 Tax=Athelia psychrophila TaxID=1759441 RepID=A0A166LZD6_9AGAM|nr:hypothetical protein FIBSPDRAFT_858442 [Fibularhizoctonia sp. CBS 109695]